MTVCLILFLQPCLCDPCIYMDALTGDSSGPDHHSANHVTADAPQRNPAGHYCEFNTSFLAFYIACLCHTDTITFDINGYTILIIFMLTTKTDLYGGHKNNNNK